MSIDFNHAGLLLHVAKESRDYPKLKFLHDAALAELEGLASKPEETLSFKTGTVSPERYGVARQMASEESGND